MNELQYKNAMTVLPLRDVVVFPRLVVPLYVGRKLSLSALEKSMEDGGQVFLVTQKSPKTETPTSDDLYTVGCVANVLQMLRLPDDTMKVLVEGISRAKAIIQTPPNEPMSAEVEMLVSDKQFGEERGISGPTGFERASHSLRQGKQKNRRRYSQQNERFGRLGTISRLSRPSFPHEIRKSVSSFWK